MITYRKNWNTIKLPENTIMVFWMDGRKSVYTFYSPKALKNFKRKLNRNPNFSFSRNISGKSL